MSESRSTLEIVRTRAIIEAHIERCRDSAAANLIEIGRWLNRAKAENIVPHGEWTAWVQEHAGMTERTAQRMMQAARELPEGSQLERLGMAKLSALLTLPPGEREEAAREMDAERLSSREVSDRVAALKRERDEALRVVKAQKEDFAQKNGRARNQITDLKHVIESNEKSRKRLNEQIDAMRAQNEQLREEAVRLKSATRPDPAQIAEYEKRIEALAQMVRDKDRALDDLTDEMDELKTRLARGTMESGGVPSSPATAILSAIGALMAEAGRAPGELARAASPVDEDTRRLLTGQARIVGQWCMQIIAACGGEADGGL